MSVRLWNFKDGGSLKNKIFGQGSTYLKEMTVHQMLGMILEKKVVRIYDDQEYGNSILKEKMKEPVLDKSPPWEDFIKDKTH